MPDLFFSSQVGRAQFLLAGVTGINSHSFGASFPDMKETANVFSSSVKAETDKYFWRLLDRIDDSPVVKSHSISNWTPSKVFGISLP